jgi:hypothetical protein
VSGRTLTRGAPVFQMIQISAGPAGAEVLLSGCARLVVQAGVAASVAEEGDS